MNSLSIIVPVLNEQKILENSLNKLKTVVTNLDILEFWIDVVISDGGSRDGSREIAEKFANANDWKFVTRSLKRPSVAKTVKLGLDMVESDYVMVLPIDCELTIDCLSELRHLECDYGGFRKKYRPSTFALKLYAHAQNIIRTLCFKNLVWTNVIFAKRECWCEPDIFVVGTFLEDVLFSDNLKRKKKDFLMAHAVVYVSSRRYFEKNPILRVLLNGLIMLLFRLGIKDEGLLKKIYKIL